LSCSIPPAGCRCRVVTDLTHRLPLLAVLVTGSLLALRSLRLMQRQEDDLVPDLAAGRVARRPVRRLPSQGAALEDQWPEIRR
jgi:hypothetical protein